MTNDTRSRKWQITINNPVDKGYTHETIKSILREFKGCVYWCMSDEIGLTYHTHIYIACSNAVKFSVLKNRFEGGHFEPAKGTSQQNRDYCFKEGKWQGTDKEETNKPETHEEWGEIPVERQGKRNDLDDLYDMIKSGMSNYEIIEESPEYMLHIDKIERCRQVVHDENYKSKWRDMHVTYIYGSTGAGKTRGAMEKYGYENVFRVTDYFHPFDNYKGQNVIIFEEFRSSCRIGDMLNYLDGYPLELPCRYANKVACFTEVYIISNISLHDQYTDIQRTQHETWLAFLRRIHDVTIYTANGNYTLPLGLYMDGFVPLTEDSPFDNKDKNKTDNVKDVPTKTDNASPF